MSMKVGEILQRVESLYSHGVQSQNTRLTQRHIYSACRTARSILIRQQANKNQKISQWVYQTLPCVELILAPIHECPCIPSGRCSLLRTKYKLPKPITGLSSSLIQSVTSLDGSIKFNETTFETMSYEGGNKFTSKKPKFFIRNEYLYVTHLKNLRALTVTMLPDDFLEAINFPSACGDCEDCDCQDIMELEFPIDGDLIRPLLQLANEELIILFKQLGEDKQNNAVDDTNTSGAMIHQPGQPEQ